MKFARLITGLIALILVIGSGSLLASTPRVKLLAIFENKVVVTIDGKREVLVKDKPGTAGVTLRFTDTRGESADLEIDGKLEIMPLGFVMSATTEQSAGIGKETVTLFSDARGFFHADGYIDGRPVTFLVDTGANTVAMNSATANRIGIDYRRGKRAVAKTASGYTETFVVSLEKVEVGGLELRQVTASVIEGPQPDVPLLGMSFLGSFNMQREGNQMMLLER